MILYCLYINGELKLKTPSTRKINVALSIEMIQPSFKSWHVEPYYQKPKNNNINKNNKKMWKHSVK